MANIVDGLTKWVRAIDNRTSRRGGASRAVQRFVVPQRELHEAVDAHQIRALDTTLKVSDSGARVGEFRI